MKAEFERERGERDKGRDRAKETEITQGKKGRESKRDREKMREG